MRISSGIVFGALAMITGQLGSAQAQGGTCVCREGECCYNGQCVPMGRACGEICGKACGERGGANP